LALNCEEWLRRGRLIVISRHFSAKNTDDTFTYPPVQISQTGSTYVIISMTKHKNWPAVLAVSVVSRCMPCNDVPSPASWDARFAATLASKVLRRSSYYSKGGIAHGKNYRLVLRWHR
jgi:hypothetical protein